MPDQRFVFISELDFQLGGEDLLARVREIFAGLRAESEALIRAGSAAGVQGGYTTAIGETKALVQRAPQLTSDQRKEALGVIGGAQSGDYAALLAQSQSRLPTKEQLQPLGAQSLDVAYRRGSALIDQALTTQSNATLRAAAAADKVAQAQAKATAQADRAAAVARQRAEEAKPDNIAKTQLGQAQSQASVAKLLAANNGYIQAVASGTTSFAQIRASVAGILAKTPAYSKALADTTVSQAQTNAQVQRQLAASKDYTAATLKTSTDLARQSANLAEAQAGSAPYIAAQRRATTAEARREAAITEAETSSKAWVNAQRRNTTATANQEAAVAEAQAASKTWVRAQTRSTVAESAREASVQESLANNKRYTAATARSAIAQQAQAANLQEALSKSPKYITDTTREATARSSIAEQLAADKDYIAAKARAAAAAQKQTASVAEELAANQDYIADKVRATVATRQQAAQIAEELAVSKEYIDAKARAAVATRKEAIAVAQATDEQLKASGLGGGGTFFQRLLAASKNRSATGGQLTLPEDQPTGPQFLLSKLATTGAYLASGALFFGAISGFKQIVTEASALQRELAIIKSQFDELGDSQGFEKFSKQVVDISVNTGVAADQVALVARQLAGVFRVEGTGLPDFNKALSETNVALKLTQVTGLPVQEVTDSLTAITTTFGTSFQQISDDAIGLEQRFGVLAPEIIKFTADLAPVAKQLGFTVEQISSLGAIAQQRSGIAGSALAESFNRALPALQQSQVKVSQLLQQTTGPGGTSQFVSPLLQAFAQGNGVQVIDTLTEAYAKMTKGQQNALGELLGGQRNAKAFFAVLQGGQDTINALNNSDPAQFAGKLDDRFKDFQSTVEFAFEHARQALEKFGLALFNSGLADGLKEVADRGADVANFAAVILRMLSDINSAAGGVPVKLLAIYAAIRLLFALGAGAKSFGGLVVGALGGLGGPTTNAAGQRILSNRAASSPIVRGVVGADVDQIGNVVATGGKVRSALGSTVATLAPLLAVAMVGELVSTIQQQSQNIRDAKQKLQDSVDDAIKKGVSPELIRQRVINTGGAAKPTTGNSVLDTIGTFFLGDQQSPLAATDAALAKNLYQGRVDALKAVSSALTDQDKASIKKSLSQQGYINANATDVKPTNVDDLVNAFLSDPGNKAYQDDIDLILKAGFLSPQAVAAISKANTDFDNQLKYTQSKVNLAQVVAEYQAGQTDLKTLVDAYTAEIDAEQKIIDGLTSPDQQDQRSQLLAEAAQNKQGKDQAIQSAAQRLADVETKLAGVKGGNTIDAAANAALEKLKTAQSLGATPGAQLDDAISAVDAEQQQLNQIINSPVIVNGIARAPTAAEKLARAAKGQPIPPAVRDAVVRGSLLLGQAGLDLQTIQNAGIDQDTIVNAVATLVETGNAAGVNLLKAKLQQEIDFLTAIITAEVSSSSGDPAALASALTALQQAKAALASLSNLPGEAQDPGTQALVDTTDLKNQALIEASQEARALADALNQQEQARANGDPVLEARAAIDAANTAIHNATKPSEVQAGIAQLIEAQNAMDAANEGIIQARLQYTAALDSNDPVLAAQDKLNALREASGHTHGEAEAWANLAAQIQAQNELDSANEAVVQAQLAYNAAVDAGDPVKAAEDNLAALRDAAQHVHGEAERWANLSQQVQAQRDLQSALNDVINSQLDLASAVATASGDSVQSAEIGLREAIGKLQQAAAGGAGESALNQLYSQVVAAEANVRDTQLQKREGDIDFMLQMEKVTTQQAIAQFEALLQIPNLTAQETNEILLKIKQLKDQLSNDLKFDIPDAIKLPTIYEVRRLRPVGTPDGPGFYNNSSTSTTTVSIVVNNQGDLNHAVDALTQAVTGPQRNGERVTPF